MGYIELSIFTMLEIKAETSLNDLLICFKTTIINLLCVTMDVLMKNNCIFQNENNW